MGRKVVGAEAFTANGEYWRQYPGSMKAQGDWALAFGINCFKFHTYQHQPSLADKPGMTMCGFYGVNWHRNQTWWPMVDSYHRYLTHCQMMLQEGRPVSDILYLLPEGAPMVFQPPKDAFLEGEFLDRKGYSFDGCAPEIFISRAEFINGKIEFKNGASYSVLVLPRIDAMTPELMRKILECAKAGVKIIGDVPVKSPSLSGYPKCDEEVSALANQINESKIISENLGMARLANEALRMQAKWIWSCGEKNIMMQPHGTRWFKKTFSVEDVSEIRGACIAVTADNAYRLFINGEKVGDGIDFHFVGQYDIKRLIKSGNNVIEVCADNWDSKPNPAGLIAACVIKYANGKETAIKTDDSWVCTMNRGFDGEKDRPVQMFGGYKTGPWRLRVPNDALYQSYEQTAAILSEAGLPPDFETTGDLRYIHRRLKGKDIYFVGNRLDKMQTAKCRFRVEKAKSAEWWNPLDGETYALADWECNKGIIEIVLTLGPGESGFVVFSTENSNAVKVKPQEGNSIKVVDGPWMVSFDPTWGGPEKIEFKKLEDWSKHPNWGISHYSGIATYRKFVVCDQEPQHISLGDVANLARVKLNGKDLGSVWCPPWRVKIPAGVWKEGENLLEIEVANLWANRLIGDASLPESKRLTKTTVNPYKKSERLRRSGLLGPVCLE
jgi:hypothetical protein